MDEPAPVREEGSQEAAAEIEAATEIEEEQAEESIKKSEIY